MVRCPKELEVELSDGLLSGKLPAKCCPECGGAWIQPEQYSEWQDQHGTNRSVEPQVGVVPSQLATDFIPSELDNRAALCPECKHYLVRGRVQLRHTTFFVERCPNCKGYWCDHGEWEILQQLGLTERLECIFSDQWQARVKELELAYREKQATIEKLGPEIAARIFELAELLEKHPNGDFGVAYLMRRFEE